MQTPHTESSNAPHRAARRIARDGRSGVAAGAGIVLALGAIGSLGPPIGETAMRAFERFAHSRPAPRAAHLDDAGRAHAAMAGGSGADAAREAGVESSERGSAESGRREDRGSRHAIVYRAEEEIPEIGDVSDLPEFFRTSNAEPGSVDHFGQLADRAFRLPQSPYQGAGAAAGAGQEGATGQAVGLVAQLDATPPAARDER